MDVNVSLASYKSRMFILDISGWVFMLLPHASQLHCFHFGARGSPNCFPPLPRKERLIKTQPFSGHHLQNPFFSSAFQLLWSLWSRGELPVLLPLTPESPAFSILETWHMVLLSDVEPATLTPCSHSKGTCTYLKPPHTPCSLLPFSIFNLITALLMEKKGEKSYKQTWRKSLGWVKR